MQKPRVEKLSSSEPPLEATTLGLCMMLSVHHIFVEEFQSTLFYNVVSLGHCNNLILFLFSYSAVNLLVCFESLSYCPVDLVPAKKLPDRWPHI